MSPDGYAYAKVFAASSPGIDAPDPGKAEPISSPGPLRRFPLLCQQDILRGNIQRPTKPVQPLLLLELQ
ncbi:hypothetical protein CO661_33705 [Sinorhizobium fredii]|uniref:Uncharacterized protein n=1 Tax=Rhizobium fredii TaxID=380 RepID=A0A2A6LN35_RHIFR|nr:hypothetical protein CO661_33705 [Sinorhizobium fredii]